MVEKEKTLLVIGVFLFAFLVFFGLFAVNYAEQGWLMLAVLVIGVISIPIIGTVFAHKAGWLSEKDYRSVKEHAKILINPNSTTKKE